MPQEKKPIKSVLNIEEPPLSKQDTVTAGVIPVFQEPEEVENNTVSEEPMTGLLAAAKGVTHKIEVAAPEADDDFAFDIT